MSDFTFFTRFFVLIIVSYCVVFPSDDGHDDGSAARRVAPSLTIPVPQDVGVQGVVVVSPCRMDSHEEPTVFAGFLLVISIPSIRRTRSGILTCLGENPEAAKEAFDIFNDVVRMKKESISNIDASKRQIEDTARVVLNKSGFKWGSIYSERDYQWKSKDAEEARKSGYGYLPLVLEMMELAIKQPDDARGYLKQDIDLEIFTSNLGDIIGNCRVLLEKIDEEKSTLSKIQAYVPPSPVNYTSQFCDY